MPRIIAVVCNDGAAFVDLDCGHRFELASGEQTPTTGCLYPCQECEHYHSVANA